MLPKSWIDQFCSQEYGSEADFSDIQKVSIAYTTITDDEIPVEVYVNLIEFRLDRYIEAPSLIPDNIALWRN